MANENNKNQGPTCACGKGDLYEEWLKLQDNQKEEVSDSTTSSHAEDNTVSADDAGKDTQIQEQTKK
jgi:hypothetical protein